MVALVCAQAALAQQLPPEPVIRTQTELVQVPVTVTDAKQRFVDGLQAEDFELSVDGRRVPVSFDVSDILLNPISLAIVVQTNDIAAPALLKLNKVGSMIQPLITGDRGEAAVFSYDAEVRVAQGFTKEGGLVDSAMETLKQSRGRRARMLDAVQEAVTTLALRPTSHRKIILVFGESRDRGSETTSEHVLEAAQRQGIVIYPITYSAYATAFTTKASDRPPAQGASGQTDILGALKEIGRMSTENTADVLAAGTGGGRYSFQKLSSLEKDLTRMGQEIHSQYILSFVPPAGTSTPAYHAITVRVRHREKLNVRARAGFWSGSTGPEPVQPPTSH